MAEPRIEQCPEIHPSGARCGKPAGHAGNHSVAGHTCHASACSAPVPPEMFMCKKHWFMVPPYMRKQIWASYRDGQCDDMNPSKDYCHAAKAAVIAVALKDGVEPDTKLYDLFLARGGSSNG